MFSASPTKLSLSHCVRWKAKLVQHGKDDQRAKFRSLDVGKLEPPVCLRVHYDPSKCKRIGSEYDGGFYEFTFKQVSEAAGAAH